MSKGEKRIAVALLLCVFILFGLFTKEWKRSIPVGNETITEFQGGPNMKEASESRTEKEELLYQKVKNNKSIVKMYFLDVTADGENELLCLEETKYQGDIAARITFWGMDGEDNILSLANWTLGYKSSGARFALYLHPENDGSYSILEDQSAVAVREKEEKIQYKQFQFSWEEGKVVHNTISSTEGSNIEKQKELEKLVQLRRESIIVYDTLPEEILISIRNEKKEDEESSVRKDGGDIVRIYDVIPQGWEHVNDQTKEYVADVQRRLGSGDDYIREKAQEEMIGLEEVVFEMHPFRIGPFEAVVNEQDEIVIPYAGQIEKIAEMSGVTVDYVIMNSWEELDAELDKCMGDGITKIVLFDNTFSGSLIQEAKSERYANLEMTMNDFGFYDAKRYEQTVLEAGMIDGKQALIPLLYDVNGMIQGEIKEYAWEGHVLYEPKPIEGESIAFETFIEKLNQQMQNENSRKSVDFISTSLSEEIAPEMFLYAAGVRWDDYENQKELFELMYQYYQTYMETQVEEGGMTKQSKWGIYAEDLENTDMRTMEVPQEVIMNLELYRFQDMFPSISIHKAANCLLDSCTYIVQSSEPNDASYHNILGLIDMANYYLYQPLFIKEGEMGYWPIGIMGEDERYAAQPNNYVAVVSDGSLNQAMKVIEAMIALEVDFKYGLSVNNEVREKQLDIWYNDYGEGYSMIGSRSVIENVSLTAVDKTPDATEEGSRIFEEMKGPYYWHGKLNLPHNDEIIEKDRKEEYLLQVQEQLGNVAIAQIPDREILSIWQETLEECTDDELSVDEGFELLCAKMDAFYE